MTERKLEHDFPGWDEAELSSSAYFFGVSKFRLPRLMQAEA